MAYGELQKMWTGNNLGVNEGVLRKPDIRDTVVHICGALLFRF